MEFKLKRRKLFTQFIIYGIPSDNLYDIITPDDNDNDNYNQQQQQTPLYLTPKTLYTYPPINSDNTHNIYKPFCYKNGIPLYHFVVSSSSEYDSLLLEQNVFSTYTSSFVFMKPNTSSHDVNKYIYGMKFNDYYFIKSKNTNTTSNVIHVFKYEKCYLFITTHYNNLQLLETACMRFLQEKKLNYLNTLTHFTSLYVDSAFTLFNTNNNETTNTTVTSLITSLYDVIYNKALTYFNNTTNNNNNCCCCSYEAWLLSKCIHCYNKATFFQVLIMLLLEQQVLLYSNNIETVAFSVFMFANMLKPFKWKYTLISNLPLQQMMMLESPAPFVVGVVCDDTEIKEVYRYINASCNVVKVNTNGKTKIERSIITNVFDDDKCLYFLGSALEIAFWRVDKEMKDKDKDGVDKVMICEEIASLICEGVVKSVGEFIDKIMNEVIQIKHSTKAKGVKLIKEILNKKILNEGDDIFYNEFIETEMFASYCVDKYKYKLN